MNIRSHTKLATGLLLLVSAAVFAEESYGPAEYRPQIDYAASPAVVAPASAKAAVNQPNATAEKQHVEKPASSRRAESPAQESAKSSKMIWLPGILLAAVFFVFQKSRRKQGLQPVGVCAETATPTSVERYLARLPRQKTGVEKYLERQVETPVTGVAKYLARQQKL